MASPAASASQDKPTLGEVVDQIGLGPAQMRSGILGGGVWMADGAELLLIGSVADVLSREWELSRFLKGFVVTIVYTGLMVGNISSGPAGARLGRREVIVCSYAGIFLFSILSSTAGGIGVLLLWRFIVGWSIGFGQPAWLAINAEITPSKYRVVTGGLGQALFTVGELYAALLLQMDDPSLKHLDWRRIIQLGALPSLTLLCFCWPFLHQSPTFLQLKGRHARSGGFRVHEAGQRSAGRLRRFQAGPAAAARGLLAGDGKTSQGDHVQSPLGSHHCRHVLMFHYQLVLLRLLVRLPTGALVID